MAGSARPLLAFLLFFFLCALTFPRNRAAVAPPLCPRSDLAFLDGIESQCPLWIELSSPQEVSGETFERELSGKQSACYSILFYASWCPFSSNTRPKFDALSSMFPQIKHLLVEESSVMPSVLSRNGIHSFPAVMLIDGTTRVQYHGSRDLTSLVQFYKKNTGLNPVIYLEIEQLSSERVRSHVPHVESARELISHEPYLTFSIFFICLKIIMCFFPVIYSRIKAFWVSHAWPLNSRVLCESSQLLEQALHVIDVKRLWSNLRLCNKTRNFQKGANNARAWASSLASVSLSESSSSRLALVDS
ncbi:5'-adenylylsulfate reductase-like 5 [Musa acuminata AAA Group]|uniref:5'-adenylylsulfate reductase-like 5 n=1 Tax=Musa acuminata AAA Group TaxID=214697 RepID=UPI0031DC7234